MYLHIDQIEKSFIKNRNEAIKVLEQIDMDVERGSFVSIVGPSGCGKSTLLYMIAGLVAPDQGAIHLEGNVITSPGPDRVVVFQESGLFPWLSVKDNIAYGLKLRRLSKPIVEKKVEDVLKLVHLSRFANSYPHQLSGGMKQRVAIARALIMEPDVLLMDEPFSALDEQTRMVLHKELLNIWRKTKVTILFITHNIREAVLLSEKIVVFSARPGKIKETIHVSSSKEGIMPDPLSLYTEQRILKLLEEEIEMVMKEEMGDDYSFKADHVHRTHSGDMGSHI